MARTTKLRFSMKMIQSRDALSVNRLAQDSYINVYNRLNVYNTIKTISEYSFFSQQNTNINQYKLKSTNINLNLYAEKRA